MSFCAMKKEIFFVLIPYFLCVSVFVFVISTCAMVHVSKSKDKSKNWACFPTVGSWDQTQMIRIVWQVLLSVGLHHGPLK